MGGGVSATNPGFHIFVVAVTAMTGLPDYLAQALVASFFSALVSATSYLIVKTTWNKIAALMAALLVAFSSSDIAF
jgi:4-amino-4-deoxy-L-arabinose transferase-like glycosyltransferase